MPIPRGGSNCKVRKLTDNEVRMVMALPWFYGSGRMMAKLLQVSDSTISRIRNGILYLDVHAAANSGPTARLTPGSKARTVTTVLGCSE